MPITNTAFLFTHANVLYVGFRSQEPRPWLPQAACTNRDDHAIWEDSCFEIFVRPTRDSQTYYQLAANALGAQWDGYDQQGSEWNAQWEAKGHRERGVWFVEAAIPLKELVFEENPPQGWGLNFCYTRKGDAAKGTNAEYYTWQGGFHKPETWREVRFEGVDLKSLCGARTGCVLNGSFEDGLTGWTPTGNVEWVQTPTGHGLRLQGGEARGVLCCPPWPVNPYVGVTARWTAKIEAGKAGEATLEGRTETGQSYSVRLAISCSTGQWVRQEADLYSLLAPVPFTNRPKELTFQSVRLRGDMTLDGLSLEGSGFGFPFPPWDGRFKQQLDPRIRWAGEERLRILWGMPMAVHHLRPGRNDPTLIARFLPEIAKAGLNVAIVNGSEVWWENPLSFYRNKTALIETRRSGFHVGFRVGYVKSRPGMPVRAFTTAKGDKPTAGKNWYYPCLLDERLWKSQLEQPALRLFDWLESEGLRPAEAVDVIAYDNEHIANGEHCFCEGCVQSFLKSKHVSFTKDPAAPVDVWLRYKGLYDEFKSWQEESLAGTLAGVRDRIRKRHATALFMFYYYHHEDWACRAQMKGLGTPALPAIPFMDKCYWSGYAGSPHLVNAEFNAMSDYLGYTPLYAPSIDFYTATHYAAYTPRRAAQELYLLTRASPGSVMYGEERTPQEDLFQAYLPYWEEFRKATAYLAEEGVISLKSNRPSAELSKKLDRAQTNAAALIRQQWAEAGDLGRSEGTSDNDPVWAMVEGRTRLTKTCDSLVQGGRPCDPISNGQKGVYTFNLQQAPKGKRAAVWLTGELGLWERARIPVWVNGERVGVLRGRDVFQAAWKEARITVPIPVGRLKAANLIEIAYLDGDDARVSLGDTYFRLREVSMEWGE